MKDPDEIDVDEVYQMALEYWQDDLAKFFVLQKEPTYVEYKMFLEGYKKALKDVLNELKQGEE